MEKDLKNKNPEKNNVKSLKRKMFFKMILSSLLRRRSRMLIAMLAIVVGATVLFGLVTIYYDIPRQMSAEFRNYGANVILRSATENGLTDDDISKAKSKTSYSITSTPYRYENVKIHNQPVTAFGTTFDTLLDTSPYWYVSGSVPETAYIEEYDSNNELLPSDELTYYVILGKNVSDNLNLKVGSTFEVAYTYDVVDDSGNSVSKSLNFMVSGIVQTGGSEEDYIYVDYDALVLITGEDSGYDLVELSVNATSQQVSSFVDSVNNDSNLKDIMVASIVKRVTSSESSVLTKLQGLILLVTIIITALTIICVTTTMNSVINERRKEIALRKSIGASNKDIIKEFMTEVMTLGIIGGIIGSLLGFGFAEIVSINVFASSITFLPWLLPIVIFVSMLVTGLSCFLPIRNAMAVDAAKVLKGE